MNGLVDRVLHRCSIWLVGLEVQNWKHVEIAGQLKERQEAAMSGVSRGWRLYNEFPYSRHQLNQR